MVVGRPPDPNVVFFEKAVIDRARSEAEGRRIYETKIYIKKSYPGVTDWVAHEASRQEIEKHRAEYDYFIQNRQGVQEAGINIIPGLNIIHMQELTDYGLSTISRLAEADTVPPHLQYAQDLARKIQLALGGEQHGEEGKQEGGPGGREEHVQAQGAEAVPAPSGREHGGPVERPEPARVRRDGAGRGAGERQADRQVNSFGGVNPNFDISFG
jgi:hypothetical protein